ncbi:MAG: tetratricopeptide repeat protein [Blastocatellia bacterium]|jgi:tetratricopeptide (TPR) repeat protein
MGSLFGLKMVALWVLILFQEGGATERFNRAVALQQRGEMAAAVDEYREAIRMRPDYVEAHANLAVALVRLGRSDEAVLAYEAALRLAPGLTPVRLNLGILHYRTGRFEAAIEVFERILREQPRSIQASQLCGLALSALGRDEEAIARLSPTIDAAPPDPAVLYSLGLGYLRLGRAGFRAILERLAALPAGRPVLHLLQGQAFLRDQNYETALEELRSAARLSADLPRLHFSLGVAHSLLGQNKEAIAALEIAVTRYPRDTTALYYLADAQAKDGNFGQARRRVEESLRLDPKSPEATGLLGKILLREGKAAEAVKLLESAVRAPGKTSTDHDLHYNLARAYQQLGRREDATRQFAEVQRLKAAQLRKDRANLPGQ